MGEGGEWGRGLGSHQLKDPTLKWGSITPPLVSNNHQSVFIYHPLQLLSSSGEQCHCILVDRWRRTHDHYITCAKILHPLPTPLPEHSVGSKPHSEHGNGCHSRIFPPFHFHFQLVQYHHYHHDTTSIITTTIITSTIITIISSSFPAPSFIQTLIFIFFLLRISLLLP